MIAVEHLRKRFGSQAALDDVSFTVPQGEIFGFVGPNGAGKTTTIRILATLTRADSGQVSLAGVALGEDPVQARSLVGYMPDFFGVYDRLTAREYLEFHAACHGLPRGRRGPIADQLLELVDLGSRAQAPVDTLSRGMKQRLALARALVHGPQVLLLDEPASGLDPRARVEMKELIKELQRMGKTVLISSHILPELEELCTWVGFIDQGRMAAAGPMGEVRQLLVQGRRVRVTVDGGDGELKRLSDLAAGKDGVSAVHPADGHLDLVVDEGCPDSELLAWLVAAGVKVRSFSEVTGDLSEAFLRLTQVAE